MMKLGFVAFFLLHCLVLGWSLELTGRVVNQEGKPVSSAVVLHRESGKKVLTDKEGFFALTIPSAEKVRLEIIHPEYMEEEVRLSEKKLSRLVMITLSPYIRQREEVVVTAMRFPEPSAKVPAASTVVTAEAVEEKIAANVVEGLANVTGVTALGSGGFSLVPSIRGLARRRVLLMIDNARLSSDRRTGPSASFISPEDIGKVEVLRSPSSVFYGSDAIGGVVHILTRESAAQDGFRGRLNAKFGTVNREKGLGFSLAGAKSRLGYYVSIQGIDAEDYSSPRAEVLQSRFTQGSLLGKIRYQNEKREIEATFLLSRGKNIGKPNKDSATKPTWYPRENQNLAQLHWQEKGVWRDGELAVHLFMNPNFLETESEKLGTYKMSESYSRTESTDFGVQLSLEKKVQSGVRLTAGTDFLGRIGAQASNRDRSFDEQGNVTATFEETPYAAGRRHDFGFFVSADYDGLKNVDLVAGVRLDLLSSRANPGGGSETSKNSDEALTGFLAGSIKLSEEFIFFANVSRAFRAPDLNERFYTGITGRGFIIANPALRPESSLSFDAGLKLVRRRFFAGLYGFSYELKNMIERYKVADKTYTYENVERGAIRGLELEWEFFPLPGWSVFGNVSFIRGKSLVSAEPLNDIPSQRLFLGARAWVGRFSFEVNGTLQRKKDNPGPAEIAIPPAQYANLKASYFLAPSVNVYFVLSNLFDEAYYARPDPEAMEEPGRSFVFGLVYSFGN